MSGSSHENLERDERLEPGSARSFGLVMATALLALAAWKLWTGAAIWAIVWTAFAAAFGGLALATPKLLAPLNRLWFRFGLLLHRIMSPLVMGLLFFAVVLPIGLLMRLFGQRPLALGFDRTATSYWSLRADSVGRAGSMKKQY